MIVTFLSYSLILKIEAADYFETLVNIYWTTRHHISEDSNFISAPYLRIVLFVRKNESRAASNIPLQCLQIHGFVHYGKPFFQAKTVLLFYAGKSVPNSRNPSLARLGRRPTKPLKTSMIYRHKWLRLQVANSISREQALYYYNTAGLVSFQTETCALPFLLQRGINQTYTETPSGGLYADFSIKQTSDIYIYICVYCIYCSMFLERGTALSHCIWSYQSGAVRMFQLFNMLATF
jgi:hypothetical protein